MSDSASVTVRDGQPRPGRDVGLGRWAERGQVAPHEQVDTLPRRDVGGAHRPRWQPVLCEREHVGPWPLPGARGWNTYEVDELRNSLVA